MVVSELEILSSLYGCISLIQYTKSYGIRSSDFDELNACLPQFGYDYVLGVF